DRDVVGVGEGCRGAIEGGIVEAPLRGSELPDELREVMPVLVVASSAALGREVVLVPPLELVARWQWHLACRLASDQVAADGDESPAALRPQGRDDVGGSSAPVETGEDGALDLESVHEIDGVDGERRWLTVPHGVVRAEARRPVTAQVRDDHPVAPRRQ